MSNKFTKSLEKILDKTSNFLSSTWLGKDGKFFVLGDDEHRDVIECLMMRIFNLKHLPHYSEPDYEKYYDIIYNGILDEGNIKITSFRIRTAITVVRKPTTSQIRALTDYLDQAIYYTKTNSIELLFAHGIEKGKFKVCDELETDSVIQEILRRSASLPWLYK